MKGDKRYCIALLRNFAARNEQQPLPATPIVINQQTAEALGLAIPQSPLLRANEVIL